MKYIAWTIVIIVLVLMFFSIKKEWQDLPQTQQFAAKEETCLELQSKIKPYIKIKNKDKKDKIKDKYELRELGLEELHDLIAIINEEYPNGIVICDDKIIKELIKLLK